jgi:hypothetical protein
MLKYCAVFSLCAGLGLGGSFITGQGARVVIGQTTFTSQSPGASSTNFGSVGGLAFAGDTLYVTDANRLGLLPINNRVLMYQQIKQFMPSITAPIAPYTGRCPVCWLGPASMELGQPDFVSVNPARTQSGMNLPLAVASDGTHLAVADTSNNRILIWNSIPTVPGQNADIVLGQADFTSIVSTNPLPVTASAMRAPQGVWFQNGKFFVADTQNNRVLIWNSIPAKNNQAADVVLGVPNFTTVPNFDQTKNAVSTTASTLLTPTSVTSDGIHLFVTDLGFSRVLIWNSIPTANGQAADVEIGQKDMLTSIPDDTSEMCASTGTDSNGNPTYPAVCGSTMNFPRFALSDGTRLFVADGGNDRVLVYNTIPTQNAAKADVILGEPDEFSDVVTSNTDIFTPNLTQSGAAVTPTPTSLAWDGQNLYVSDPSNFRILVFSPLEPNILATGVVNAGSLAIYALGTVTLGGTITAGNAVTVTVNGTDYKYTIVTNDTLDTISAALATMMNQANADAGDPNVLAQPLPGLGILQLIARQPGTAGNSITLATTLSTNATLTSVVSSSTLQGGGNAAVIAPGTIVAIQGNNLADAAVGTDPNATTLPLELGGVQVYVDGIRAPIFSVSPTQITAQVPYEVVDANSSSVYARITHADGSISVTDAIGIPVDQENPGIFAMPGTDPRPGIAYHASSYAAATVSVDGSIATGDTASVAIEDRTYSYNVQSSDSLSTIRDGLIALINANSQEKVVASAASAFTRIRLIAKVLGPEGDGIQISATSTGTAAGSAGSVTMTALNAALCCANVAGARITNDNPAIPGENIYVLATGLGLVAPDAAKKAIADGQAYYGPAINDPNSSVSSLAGGSTATVLSAGLMVGSIGIYQVVLQLASGLPTNPLTQLTIAQDIYSSNIIAIPVLQPVPTAP